MYSLPKDQIIRYPKIPLLIQVLIQLEGTVNTPVHTGPSVNKNIKFFYKTLPFFHRVNYTFNFLAACVARRVKLLASQKLTIGGLAGK